MIAFGWHGQTCLPVVCERSKAHGQRGTVAHATRSTASQYLPGDGQHEQFPPIPRRGTRDRQLPDLRDVEPRQPLGEGGTVRRRLVVDEVEHALCGWVV